MSCSAHSRVEPEQLVVVVVEYQPSMTTNKSDIALDHWHPYPKLIYLGGGSLSSLISVKGMLTLWTDTMGYAQECELGSSIGINNIYLRVDSFKVCVCARLCVR